MTDSPNNADRVLDLAESIFDGGASPEMLDELDNILLADGDSRDRYLGYCRLQVALRMELRADRAASRTHRMIEIESACPAVIPSNAPVGGVFHNALNTTVGFFSHEMALSLLVATVVMSSALLLAWRFNVTHYRHVADTGSPADIGGPIANAEYVGRITGMKDCRWNDPDTAPLARTAVLLGREYALESGLLEITYKSGARVILEGPCKYKVDSTAGGYLAVGKLTARVEKRVASGQWLVARKKGKGERGEGRGNKGAAGNQPRETADEDVASKPLATSHQPPATNPTPSPRPLAPLFSVTTPTAVVTDLGTEFGVKVSPEAGTEVHVFRGKVEAKWLGSAGNEKKVQLNAGEGAGFDEQRGVVDLFSAIPGDFPHAIASVRRPVDVAANKTIVACSGVFGLGDAWANSGRFSVRCVNNGVTDESTQESVYWLGRERMPNEYFTIDLWGRFDVERIELMNTHNSRGNDRGTKDFEIWAADEINGNKLVAPRLVLHGTLPCRFDAGKDIPYDVFSVAAGDFSLFNARYVMFVAKTYHHGDLYGGCGLNEIKVFALPAKKTGDPNNLSPADDVNHDQNAGAITQIHKEPHNE